MNGILFWIIIAVETVFCLIAAFVSAKRKKYILSLTKSIRNFFDSGKAMPAEPRTGALADLQNEIAQLTETVSLEKSRAAAQAKENSEFVSDVSHRLKTPVAALKLYLEMDNSEGTNHTEQELKLIGDMEKIIYSLIRLEKIKSDAMIMNFETNSSTVLINSVITELKPIYPKKRFIISGECRLRCDAERMSEALLNIIKNACEHTETNGEINIALTDSENSTVIEISDNGGGAAPADLPRLFDRFYNAERAPEYSTGIGLATAKAIVGRHHGIITAENKNGGLCVSICIPKINCSDKINLTKN